LSEPFILIFVPLLLLWVLVLLTLIPQDLMKWSRSIWHDR